MTHRALPVSALAAVIVSAIALPSPVLADVFVLSNQGQVQGELVNKTESPRLKYVIQTAPGVTVTLDKEQVVEVKKESPAQAQYEKIRGNYPDTLVGQWQLAEWCRENRLTAARETHLRRILEIEPDHEGARRALGYGRVDGRWGTQEEVMTARGYVRYKGDWKLPQEVEVIEAKRKSEVQEKDWMINIARWRGWLGTDKADRALQHIADITDPFAVRAIKEQLEKEKLFDVKNLWLETLGRIGTPYAMEVLCDRSLFEPNFELRLTALDLLEEHKAVGCVNTYIAKLKDHDNAMVNRAAAGLGKLGDKSAIGPLIDALVTTHKFTVTKGSEAITSSFPTSGGGGGGFSFGSKTEIVKKQFTNESVRDALVKISGANFNYDQARWKVWHAGQKRELEVNARRD